MSCSHSNVTVINPHEFIRKYRCLSCREVMMCECDAEFGRRFLPHQLRFGTDKDTQLEVPVTIGFQKGICEACRGHPELACPMAETYGRTSKIVRYYWREIFFETTRRTAKEIGSDDVVDIIRQKSIHDRIEREVIDEMRRLHEVSPKYRYSEESANDVLAANGVGIIALHGEHVPQVPRGIRIRRGNALVTPEEFVSEYFSEQGYECVETESVPFHVMFGTFMWMLISDPDDPLSQFAQFGSRTDFDNKVKGPLVVLDKPPDFGAPAYCVRRATAVARHFKMIPQTTHELLWLFDYWIGPSEALRQYLWAHRQKDIDIARKLVERLPVAWVHKILHYLLDGYWNHYLGWPDLVCLKNEDLLFVEVKSSKDKLSEDQKRWIKDNHAVLKFPFKLVKIHRV